jgi:hypothetical protein
MEIRFPVARTFCGLESLFLARHGLVPESSPEIPEPIWGQLGVPDRVLNATDARAHRRKSIPCR